MKQNIYLFIILALNTCVDQGSDDIEFTLFNQTNKNVEILGFDRDFDNPENSERATPINIAPNSSFKVTRTTGMGDNVSMYFYSLRNGVDSVRVIFNNEKVIVYGRTTGNPCYICTGDENYQHFITEQDYESAADCNGNCD